MEEVNPLPVIGMLLEKKLIALNATILDITKMIVQSLRKTRSLRRLTNLKRVSWKHGMIQNKKTKILIKSMQTWHSWSGPAREKHHQKTN